MSEGVYKIIMEDGVDTIIPVSRNIKEYIREKKAEKKRQKQINLSSKFRMELALSSFIHM